MSKGVTIRSVASTPAFRVTGPDWSRTYAVRVTDDTASPRYDRGEVVHVDPHEPVQNGDWALVVRKPQQGESAPVSIIGKYLTTLVDGDKRTIILHRLPFGACEIDGQTVLTIHQIVGSSES